MFVSSVCSDIKVISHMVTQRITFTMIESHCAYIIYFGRSIVYMTSSSVVPILLSYLLYYVPSGLSVVYDNK